MGILLYVKKKKLIWINFNKEQYIILIVRESLVKSPLFHLQ